MDHVARFVVPYPRTEVERCNEVVSPPIPVEGSLPSLLRNSDTVFTTKPSRKRIGDRELVPQGANSSKVLILQGNNIKYLSNNTVMPKIISVQGNVPDLGFPLSMSNSSVPPSTRSVESSETIPKIVSVHGNTSIPKIVSVQGNVTSPNKYILALSPTAKAPCALTKFIPIVLPTTAASSSAGLSSRSALGVISLSNDTSTTDTDPLSTTVPSSHDSSKTTKQPPPAENRYFKCGNKGLLNNQTMFILQIC